MSNRDMWPTWVIKTLRYEALELVLPMYSVLIWAIGVAWGLAWTGIIPTQWAILTSMAGIVGGMVVTLIYFAYQGDASCDRLCNDGEAKALARSLGARHYISWQWLIFGWLIILVSVIQPKRPAG